MEHEFSCGNTDGHIAKLIVSFSNFVNVPKNGPQYIHLSGYQLKT